MARYHEIRLKSVALLADRVEKNDPKPALGVHIKARNKCGIAPWEEFNVILILRPWQYSRFTNCLREISKSTETKEAAGFEPIKVHKFPRQDIGEDDLDYGIISDINLGVSYTDGKGMSATISPPHTKNLLAKAAKWRAPVWCITCDGGYEDFPIHLSKTQAQQLLPLFEHYRKNIWPQSNADELPLK